MTYKDLLKRLVDWHIADRQHNLRRTFELGDLLNLGILHTGLTEYELIRRWREDAGDMAYGVTTYNRAARISRVFTRNQRKVLIDKAISLDKVEMLAGDRFAGRKRINMIANIKSGKTKGKDIRPRRRKLYADGDITGALPGDENPTDYLCSIVLKGDEDEDHCEAAIVSLLSALRRMHQPVTLLVQAALERINKMRG